VAGRRERLVRRSGRDEGGVRRARAADADRSPEGPIAGLDDDIHPTTLDEGQGIELAKISPKQVPWVEVTGELWSSPVRRVLMPDEAEGGSGRRWCSARTCSASSPRRR
jgi:hypothetical protein